MNAISGRHPSRRRIRKPTWRLALVIALITPAAACGGSDDSANTPASPSQELSSPTSATAPTTTTTTPTMSARHSAADQLAGFFTAARRMDAELARTAKLINAEIGAETMQFSPNTITAIKAIDPRPMAKTIPGGMTTELQRSVYLLFSELASRRYAFAPVLEVGPGQTVPRGSPEADHVLEGLSHGSPAAARFRADLAAARALASSRTPIAPTAPDSRANAEVAVHTAYIIGQNSGCGSSGGWLSTTVTPLVWQQDVDFIGQRIDGQIGIVRFRADYQPGQGWTVYLYAC